MAELIRIHGKTRSKAREIVKEEIKQTGYGRNINWDACVAKASLGSGAILSAEGRVTEEAIILDRCGGAVGGSVLAQCRDILERVFSGGEQVSDRYPD